MVVHSDRFFGILLHRLASALQGPLVLRGREMQVAPLRPHSRIGGVARVNYIHPLCVRGSNGCEFPVQFSSAQTRCIVKKVGYTMKIACVWG